MFLLGSTWLALNIWVAEHGPLLAATAVCVAHPGLASRVSRHPRVPHDTGTQSASALSALP
jgi:hypothetical protein